MAWGFRSRRPYPSRPGASPGPRWGLRPQTPFRGFAPDPVSGASPRTPAPQTPEGLIFRGPGLILRGPGLISAAEIPLPKRILAQGALCSPVPHQSARPALEDEAVQADGGLGRSPSGVQGQRPWRGRRGGAPERDG
ncbi:hypothetical protein GCM10010094_44410 [Streptomyces flaveus]|uniref:Uncharacterized protein n=1 Tax=Streptomyces flaveus TaxID=66370 RepID=A0A917VGP9_9ACTN|nr:hypothetical protein GCM10010094_44410 [Streptomyces flaveus]